PDFQGPRPGLEGAGQQRPGNRENAQLRQARGRQHEANALDMRPAPRAPPDRVDIGMQLVEFDMGHGRLHEKSGRNSRNDPEDAALFRDVLTRSGLTIRKAASALNSGLETRLI